MLTITKLKMWKDPGYTRGCVEIPPAGSKKLPAADYSLTQGETLRPRKNSTLTALELPLSFTQVFEMSYLYIEASDGNGSLALFGWIESIEQTASAEAAVLIRWSVDWWRSYSDSAVFGRARVTHCADAGFKRPYRNEPRKWKCESFERFPINDPNYPYSVVIVYNEVENKSEDVSIGGVPAVAQWTETHIQYVFWDCSLSAGKDTLTSGNVTYHNPSLRDIYTGDIDEMLGINPENITGIFIVPILGWVKDSTNVIRGDNPADQSKSRFAYKKTPIMSSTFGFTLSRTYESSDYKKAVIIDPHGSIVGTLPWGFKTNSMGGYADVGTVGAVTRMIMGDTNDSSTVVGYAAEGRAVDIPAITCPVNSNAWSSYVYSGKRDYEMKMKEAQRTSKAIEGAVSGAVIGSIAGSGIGGIAGGVVGAGLSSMFGEITDDKLQQITDEYYSNQSSNVLIGGGGEGWAYDSAVKDWYIVQLTADDVSMDEYDDNVLLNGYETDMTVPDVTSFITAGGAFSCSDLVITGDLPPQAKQEIKSKFESGVYITENNPSGVVP